MSRCSLLLIWLAGSSLSIPALAQSCRDIAGVDFRNSTIRAARDDGKHDYGLFNGPGPGGEFRLHNGESLQWDLGPRDLAPLSDKERVELMGQPDWKITLEQDNLLHPAGSAGVRVLVLHQVHLTGTGAFTYVFAFGCKGGKVRKIFEASGESVQLERATDGGLDLSAAIWSKGNAHCCPSGAARVHYEWSAALGRFVRQPASGEVPWLP